MSVSLPSTGAVAEADCSAVVKACDKALADQDRVIELHKKKDEAYRDLVAAQDTRIKELNDQKPGFFQKPEIWFAVGLIVGAYVVGRTKQ